MQFNLLEERLHFCQRLLTLVIVSCLSSL